MNQFVSKTTPNYLKNTNAGLFTIAPKTMINFIGFDVDIRCSLETTLIIYL